MKSRIKKILKLLKKYITGVRHNLIPLPRKPEEKLHLTACLKTKKW